MHFLFVWLALLCTSVLSIQVRWTNLTPEAKQLARSLAGDQVKKSDLILRATRTGPRRRDVSAGAMLCGGPARTFTIQSPFGTGYTIPGGESVPDTLYLGTGGSGVYVFNSNCKLIDTNTGNTAFRQDSSEVVGFQNIGVAPVTAPDATLTCSVSSTSVLSCAAGSKSVFFTDGNAVYIGSIVPAGFSPVTLVAAYTT